MAESRQRRDWDHTSAILAMLYNTGFAAVKHSARPEHFNPFSPRTAPPKPVPVPFSVLRQVFVPDSLRAQSPAPTGLIGGGRQPIRP